MHRSRASVLRLTSARRARLRLRSVRRPVRLDSPAPEPVSHGSLSDGPADIEPIAASNAQHRALAGDTGDAEPSDDDEDTSNDGTISEGDGELPATTTAIIFADVLFPCSAMLDSGVKAATIINYDLVDDDVGSLIDDHAWTKVCSAALAENINVVIMTPPITTFTSTPSDGMPALRGYGEHVLGMTGLTRAVKAELAAENLHWLRASKLALALTSAGKPWCLLTLKADVTPFDLD